MVRKYIILTKEKEKCHVLADFVKKELQKIEYWWKSLSRFNGAI